MREHRAVARVEVVDELDDQGRCDGVLRGEVVVQAARQDSDLIRDVAHTRSGDALREEESCSVALDL